MGRGYGNLHEMHPYPEAPQAQGVYLPFLWVVPMTSSLNWRKIEAELEAWARGERRHKDRPMFELDRNSNSGDIWARSYGSCPELNLTSLARRLADTLTLRLTEPAPKAELSAARSKEPGAEPSP